MRHRQRRCEAIDLSHQFGRRETDRVQARGVGLQVFRLASQHEAAHTRFGIDQSLLKVPQTAVHVPHVVQLGLVAAGQQKTRQRTERHQRDEAHDQEREALAGPAVLEPGSQAWIGDGADRQPLLRLHVRAPRAGSAILRGTRP